MLSYESLLRLELKYCELCGGLWLRPAGDLTAYCPPCSLKMAVLPGPRPKPPNPERARDSRQAAGPLLTQAVLAFLNYSLDTGGLGWCL